MIQNVVAISIWVENTQWFRQLYAWVFSYVIIHKLLNDPYNHRDQTNGMNPISFFIYIIL